MLGIYPIDGLGKVSLGDNIPELILENVGEHLPFKETDCLVIDSSIVSIVRGKTATFIDEQNRQEIIRQESKRILRSREGFMVSQTQHGLVCINGGAVLSSEAPNTLLLLPADIDSAAHAIRKGLQAICGSDIPVIVSAAFHRPFRIGKTNCAIGVSGIETKLDPQYSNSTIAIVDEIASAANLVTFEQQSPAVLVRGLPPYLRGEGKGTDLVRNQNDELFF